MASLREFIKDANEKAQLAFNVARYVSNAVLKELEPRYYGVCPICHDLRPHGYQPGVSRGTSLVVSDVSTREILNARTTDKKTGQPKRNCRYCRLLCDVFDAFFIDEWMSWRTETLNGMPISVGFMIRQDQPLIVNCLNFTYDKHFANPRVDLELYLNPAITLPPQLMDAAPCMGPTGHRELDAGSNNSMMFVKESVFECYTEHAACKQNSTGFTPTRLLSLGRSNDELRICDDLQGQQNITWAALSHCWGGEKPFRLMKDNISTVKQHIRYTELPPTFRDAITITRTLPLQYVWIDSMCIVQDDSADWTQEAARMGQVYGEANLVISAASSSNPSTTFLAPRSDEWACKTFDLEAEGDVEIPITVRRRHLLAPDVEQGLMEPPFTMSWATLKREGPLYNRGWCWQEAFMATRALHFAPGAVIFECKTHRRSQDQLPPYPSTTSGTLGHISDMEQWHMIVKSYTARQLTFGRDKLPAIGGAARNMPQATRSLYLAGLWRETLLLDLLWHIMPGFSRQVMVYNKEEQAAPSWSWASMQCGIVWDQFVSPQLLAEFVDAEVIPSSTDSYGQVAGGRVCIRGRMLRCIYTCSDNKLEYWVHYTKSDGSSSPKQHVRVDGALAASPPGDQHHPWLYRAQHESEYHLGSETRSGSSAFFLCLAKTPSHSYTGLVLSPSRSMPSCVERVGRITNLPRHWYESGEFQTVTIV